MAAQYVAIKRISSLDTPITAEKLDGSLFTTENQAHEFIISVRKNGVKQAITGTVLGKFNRANGTTILMQGSVVDGDAVVRLHPDCYNVQGRFTFNIFNSQSGVTTCVYSAVGKMDMGSTETVIDAGNVVPDISDVVAKQEEMTQVIADARTATTAANTAATNVGSIVAGPYSAPYNAGEYCTQNGIVYRAKQDIPSDEEWTASHWTQTVVGDELTDLKSALNSELDISDLDWELGTMAPGTGATRASNTRIRSDFVKVAKGTKIAVSGNAKCLIVYLFTKSYEYISDSVWDDGNTFIVENVNAYYARILIRKSTSDGTITSEEISTQAARCSIETMLPDNAYLLKRDILDLQNEIAKKQDGSYLINISEAMFARKTMNVSSDTVVYSESTTRILTYPAFPVDGAKGGKIVAAPTSGYKYIVYQISGTSYIGTYSNYAWSKETSEILINSNTDHVVLAIAKNDNSTITTDDYNKVSFQFVSKPLVDLSTEQDISIDLGIVPTIRQINAGYISASDKVSFLNVGEHIVFNATPGMKFYMLASSERNTNYCFLKSYTKPSKDDQDYDVCNNCTRVVVAKNGEAIATVPYDCNYILIAIKSDAGYHIPQRVELDGNLIPISAGKQYVYITGKIADKVNSSALKINKIETELSAGNLFIGNLYQGNVDSSGNLGSASQKYVTTVSAVAVPYQNVSVTVKAPSGYGLHIFTGYVTSSTYLALSEDSGLLTNEDVYDFDNDGYNIYRIVFVKNNGADDIAVSEVQDLIDNGQIALQFTNNDGNAVVRNSHSEQYIKNIVWKGKGHRLDEMPVFTHMSDIHGDPVRALNFLQYSEFLDADAALISGDLVPMSGLYDKTDYIDYLINRQSGITLFCIGNHDARGLTTKAGQSGILNNIITKYSLSTPLGESNPTYYYKDFSEKKIRLIALNMYEAGQKTTNHWRWTQDQIDWFIATLADAPQDYGVIVMMHSPEKTMTAVTGKDKFVQSTSVTQWGNGNPITKIIDAFISGTTLSDSFEQETSGATETITITADFTNLNSGVEFICYVTGHRHADCIGYTDGTTNIQLNCNVTLGYALEGFSYYSYYCDKESDTPRSGKGVTQDAFNVYAIDRTAKCLRVARVGSNVKNDMTLRDYLVIPYAT